MVSEPPVRRLVGRYLVDLSSRQVFRGAAPVDLNWRCLEALCLLVEAQGRVVEREVLFARLWPGVTVEESSLTKIISQLRKALGDGDPEREYVETVARVGYRLVAAVQPEDGGAAPPKRWWRQPAALALALVALAVAIWFGRRTWLDWQMQREAEQAYQEGLRLTRKREGAAQLQALEAFRRAIRLNPNHARAYAGLAESMPGWPSPESAVEAARRSVALDPNCGECRAALGVTLFNRFWNLQEAGQQYQQAIALKPSDPQIRLWHAQLLAVRGQLEPALREIDQAIALDPYFPNTHSMKAGILYFLRRYPDAVASADRALALDRVFPPAWEWRSRADFQLGHYSSALDAMFRHRSAWQEFWGPATQRFQAKGLPAALRGLMEDMHDRGIRGGSLPHYRAGWFMLLGEHDAALVELEAAADARSFNLIYLAVDPAFDPLRQRPEFQRLLTRLGLPTSPPR
jgi:DNA-binding winged helix-turn-helix (wHTH) protein/Tfp pilus assembly protein PilF